MSVEQIQPTVLKENIARVLGDKARSVTLALDEVTVEVSPQHYVAAMQLLRDAPECKFEMLMDLCGVDYSSYKEVGTDGPRFAVVSHLLSISLNQRVRVRVFCQDDDFPVLDTQSNLWASANW